MEMLLHIFLLPTFPTEFPLPARSPFALEELRHELMQLSIRSSCRNGMSRIRKHPKRIMMDMFSREHINEMRAILKMHVIIGTTLSQEEMRMLESLRNVDRRVLVPLYSIRTVSDTLHVPFRIDGIVEAPVRYRCNGHT